MIACGSYALGQGLNRRTDRLEERADRNSPPCAEKVAVCAEQFIEGRPHCSLSRGFIMRSSAKPTIENPRPVSISRASGASTQW